MDLLDPEMRAAMRKADEFRAGIDPSDLNALRRRDIETASWWDEGAPAATSEDHQMPRAGGIQRLRIYRGAKTRPAPWIMLIHGGGWAMGSIEQNEPLSRHLASLAEVDVVSISYRLAPEHAFPAAFEDCRDAFRDLVARAGEFGLDPARAAITGVSAGGNLAAAVALEPDVRLKAALLFFGVMGADTNTPSYLRFGDGFFGLSKAAMDQYFAWYAPDPALRGDPRLAPLLGDLTRFPPTWLCAAEVDVLLDDTLMFAEKLKAAGISHELLRVPGVAHGFINRTRMLKKALDAIAAGAAYLKARI